MSKNQIISDGSTRRDFLALGAAGIATTAVAVEALGTMPQTKDNNITLAFNPRAKLSAISSRAKQLWPVIYLAKSNMLETLEQDLEIAFSEGADAAVIELSNDPATLESAVAHARKKYPRNKIGVNYLGGQEDPYGYITGYRLAKEYALDIVWTDFCGVDLVKELPEVSLHEIEKLRLAEVFYCSGIHMKYGTLLDPSKSIEQSAYQAMGWVDGIIVTGPKTGVPADPERAQRARLALGQSYPLGTASGVSVENFHLIRDYVDFCLVNTSISDANHRLVAEKVRALRKIM